MPVCKSPFFVWFTGRTGSTYLCDLLNSHPQVYCRQEDFSEIKVADSSENGSGKLLVEINGVRFFRRLFTPAGVVDDPSAAAATDYLNEIFSNDYPACGFKLKFPNQPVVFPEIANSLRAMPNLKVVELLRTNVLKQAISLRNVERIKKLGISQSSNTVERVCLSPLDLDVELTVSHARYFLRSRHEFREQTKQLANVLTVSYEDLFSNSGAALKRILEFLDVDSTIELTSKFEKTTPDELRDAVANFDELASAVNGTELEQFLD